MQRSSKLLLGAAGLLALALIGFFLLRQPGLSDEQQIRAQLETARRAAVSHNVGGIMEIISADYQDSNSLNVDALKFMLGRALGKSGVISITLTPPVVTVQGDQATSVSHIDVQSADTGSAAYSHDLTFIWHREDSHRFLILPTKVWRIVHADYGAFPGDE